MTEHTSKPAGDQEPIRDPAHFHDRDKEIGSILSHLRYFQNISVVGPRSAGKTSMLYCLSHPALLAQYDIDPTRFIFAFIDCQELSNLSQGDIFHFMLTKIREYIIEAGLEVDLSDISERGPITYIELSDALEMVSDAGLSIIFLLDDFDAISQNERLGPAFYGGLRALAGSNSVAYVTASTDSLFDLTYPKEVLGSPFFNIFTTIRLGPLSK